MDQQETKLVKLTCFNSDIDEVVPFQNTLLFLEKHEKHSLHIEYAFFLRPYYESDYPDQMSLWLCERRGLTEEEKELEAIRKKNQKEQEERYEKAQYERLKKKYG